MRTALRSVVLALVFVTGVCLYAFGKTFRRLELLEARRTERVPVGQTYFAGRGDYGR